MEVMDTGLKAFNQTQLKMSDIVRRLQGHAFEALGLGPSSPAANRREKVSPLRFAPVGTTERDAGHQEIAGRELALEIVAVAQRRRPVAAAQRVPPGRAR